MPSVPRAVLRVWGKTPALHVYVHRPVRGVVMRWCRRRVLLPTLTRSGVLSARGGDLAVGSRSRYATSLLSWAVLWSSERVARLYRCRVLSVPYPYSVPTQLGKPPPRTSAQMRCSA